MSCPVPERPLRFACLAPQMGPVQYKARDKTPPTIIPQPADDARTITLHSFRMSPLITTEGWLNWIFVVLGFVPRWIYLFSCLRRIPPRDATYRWPVLHWMGYQPPGHLQASVRHLSSGVTSIANHHGYSWTCKMSPWVYQLLWVLLPRSRIIYNSDSSSGNPSHF